MRCLLFLAFFTLCALHCHGGDPCPGKDKLSPCTCSQNSRLTESEPVVNKATEVTPLRRKRDIHTNMTTESSKGTSQYTVVKCESLKTVRDLEEKISTALDRKWIDKLLISNFPSEHGQLANLPRDWLNYVRIRQLEIRNTQLTGDFIWNRQPLKNQTASLHWLKVSDCHLSGSLTQNTIGTVQTNGLNLFYRLQGIDFSSNHLTAVLATAFRHPPNNLSTLILANNKIQYIDPASFQYIPLLTHIDLSHNLLTTVLRTYFAAPARYLNHIDMSWNSIQFLPADFFVNMPALKSVDFSHNFFSNLPANPWSVIWRQLTFINVDGNFIECDCGLLWLLPVLNPPNSKQAEPKSLPGQIVMGQCVQSLRPGSFETAVHSLNSLKNDRLSC